MEPPARTRSQTITDPRASKGVEDITRKMPPAPPPTPRSSVRRALSARVLTERGSIPQTMEGALFQLKTTADSLFIDQLKRCLIQKGDWKDTHVLQLVQEIEDKSTAQELYRKYLAIDEESSTPPSPLAVYPLLKEGGFRAALASLRSWVTEPAGAPPLERIKEIALRYLNRRYFTEESIMDSEVWQALGQAPTRKSSFHFPIPKFLRPVKAPTEDEMFTIAQKLCAEWIALPPTLRSDWQMDLFVQRKQEQIMAAIPMSLSPVFKALEEIRHGGKGMVVAPTELLGRLKTLKAFLPSERYAQLEQISKTLAQHSLKKRILDEVARITMAQFLSTLETPWEMDTQAATDKLDQLKGEDISRDFAVESTCFHSFQVGPETVKGALLDNSLQDTADLPFNVMATLIRMISDEVDDEMVRGILQGTYSHQLPIHHTLASLTIKFNAAAEVEFHKRCSKMFEHPYQIKPPHDEGPMTIHRVSFGQERITTSITRRQAVFLDLGREYKKLATYSRTFTYTLDSQGRPCTAQIAIRGFGWEAAATPEERLAVFNGLLGLVKPSSNVNKS